VTFVKSVGFLWAPVGAHGRLERGAGLPGSDVRGTRLRDCDGQPDMRGLDPMTVGSPRVAV